MVSLNANEDIVYSLDWMGQVSVCWSKDKTRNSFIIFASDSLNKQGIEQEAKRSVWGSSLCKDYMRSPCQQMATGHLLFIKFGSSFDPGESISA